MNAIPLTQSQELGQIASQHSITLPRGRVIITLSLSISLLFSLLPTEKSVHTKPFVSVRLEGIGRYGGFPFT